MKSLTVLALALVLAACSTKELKTEVEAKASQSPVTDSQALGGTIHHAIDSSTLPEAKKAELRKILEMNKEKAHALVEKSYQYRATLIEELLSGNVDAKKVSILKKDIKKIEAERLKNTFETVEKISNIVQTHPDKKAFTEHLINIDRAK